MWQSYLVVFARLENLLCLLPDGPPGGPPVGLADGDSPLPSHLNSIYPAPTVAATPATIAPTFEPPSLFPFPPPAALLFMFIVHFFTR